MPHAKMPNTAMVQTKTTQPKLPSPDEDYPDNDYPDEVTFNINDKDEIIIIHYDISSELRMLFVERCKRYDCRRLAYLSDTAITGRLFLQKMVNVAGIGGTAREFPYLSHPDRECRRQIRVRYERGVFSSDTRRDVPQICAPKNKKDNKSHGQEKQPAGSAHHGSHEKAKYGASGKYK